MTSPHSANPERLLAARALLETTTPLKADCGKRCGAACCKPDQDGNGSMLLFPGEAALYADQPDWMTLSDSGLSIEGEPLMLLTCDGSCPRERRPLACRIFPLTPYVQDDSLTIELDVRAWPVCPLMGFGMQGLSKEFTAAVRSAMALLWPDAAQQAYFRLLTQQLDALKSF